MPQVYSTSIKRGQDAILFRREDPDRLYKGQVARTTSSLNSSTRTLRTEVDVPNPKGELLPGMFLEVKFLMSRESIPVIVPSDAIITRTGAPKIGVLDAQSEVHDHEVQLGRDFGATVEVITGLKGGNTVIIHPGDDLAEGTRVQPISRGKNPKENAGASNQGGTAGGSTSEGAQTNGSQTAGPQQNEKQPSGEGQGGSKQATGSNAGQNNPAVGVPENQTSDTR